MKRSPFATFLPPTVALAMVGLSFGSADAAAFDAADDHAMVVTTDTDAYCRSLSSELASHVPLPRDVSDLKRQGDGLCRHGEVRGGIARLRRALVVLNPNAAPR